MEKEHTHITKFISQLKSGAATESLIGVVADTTGMLSACRNLVEALDEGDGEYQAWLQQECTRVGIEPRLVLNELRTIVELFGLGDNGSDPYDILGLSRGASEYEIKYAYRALSLKYHPDTSAEGPGSEENFIRISRAYHQLTDKPNGNWKADSSEPAAHWRKEKKRTISDSQRNRGVVITVGLIIVLLFVSVMAAMNFRKRTMLSSLEQSRGAFVPPAESKIKADLKSPYRSTNQEESSQGQQVAAESTSVSVKGDRKEYAHNESQAARADDTANVDLNTPLITADPEEIEVPEALHQLRSSSEVVIKRDDLSQPDNAAENENEGSDLKNNNDQIEEQPQDETRLEMKVGDVATPVAQKSQIPKPTVIRPETQTLKKNLPTASPKLSDAEPVAGRDSRPAANVHKPKQATAPAVPALSKQKNISKTDTAALVSQADTEPLREQENSEQVDIIEEPPAPAEPPSPELDIEARVQSFIAEYVETYEKGDINQFSQFFMPDALENGKPFVKRLSVYQKQFEKTQSASLEISIIHAEEIEELVLADGRFRSKLLFKNGKHSERGGQISFELVEQEGRLLVKKLAYKFTQESTNKKDTAAFVSMASIEPLIEQERNELVEPSPKEPTAPIVPSSIDPGLLARVQSFINQYTAAYEQGNIILFSQFFIPDAVENGKPFTNRLSGYSTQFAKTANASLDITIFQVEEVDEQITLEGGFTLRIDYKSGRIFEGAGNISFELVEVKDTLRVKNISFNFNK